MQTDITVALLKQAVRSTTLYGVDSKMGAALGSLYDLLGRRHLSNPGGGAGGLTSPFPMQKPVPPGGVGKLEMPPLQVTLAALERLTCMDLTCNTHSHVPLLTWCCRQSADATHDALLLDRSR